MDSISNFQDFFELLEIMKDTHNFNREALRNARLVPPHLRALSPSSVPITISNPMLSRQKITNSALELSSEEIYLQKSRKSFV